MRVKILEEVAAKHQQAILPQAKIVNKIELTTLTWIGADDRSIDRGYCNQTNLVRLMEEKRFNVDQFCMCMMVAVNKYWKQLFLDDLSNTVWNYSIPRACMH
jgi:hypothetical protein